MLGQGGIVRVTLCPSCANAATCVNRAIRGYDVLFCDMFEDSSQTSPSEEFLTKVKPASSVNRKRIKEKPRVALKGLCENCVKRDTCALPRPRTGVWHCEEFEEIP